ncbi:MAG TPA: hypothetical protein VMT92_04085 [Steroidobacteraceae bacterium]|nr:hypothetical protein [Steroidobacteraceae bacterium]
MAKAARLAGYSGTPLAKKLGARDGTHLLALGAPADYARLLAPLPAGVVFEKALSQATGVVHFFARSRRALAAELGPCRKAMRPDAALWVSWPKMAAKVPTDLTEDAIRELALPIGLVDIIVCAVSDVWSGLKLVIRKALR